MGTQDDFAYTQNFRNHTGATTPTMLWDPSFTTWRALGVSRNSSMILLSSSLEPGTALFSGFGADQQANILETARGLS